MSSRPGSRRADDPVTLTGRRTVALLYALLGALVALQLLIAGASALVRRADLGGVSHPVMVDQAAAAAELLDRLDAENRPLALRAFNSPILRFRLLERFPDAPSRGAPRAAFRPILAAYRSAMPDREFRVYAKIRGGLAPRVLSGAPDANPANLLVVISLQDGAALEIEPSPSYRRFALVNIIALVSAGVTLALLAALAAASLATTEPLRRMARQAEGFSRRLDAPDMPERGPREIRELARAFNKMKAELRELIAGRTRTLAAVAHDMRTYLTRLRLRAETIPDEGLREKSVRDLDEMSALIDDALLLARGAGSDEPPETVDLREFVKRLVDERREHGEPARLAEHPDGPLPVDGPPLAIRRAVANLVDNAIRYGQAAEIAVRRDAGFAVIEVRDRGPGVAEAELARLTEPFYRVEASRSRDTGGSGLGLAIVQAMVDQLDGALAFENAAGGGLVARIRLPLSGSARE